MYSLINYLIKLYKDNGDAQWLVIDMYFLDLSIGTKTISQSWICPHVWQKHKYVKGSLPFMPAVSKQWPNTVTKELNVLQCRTASAQVRGKFPCLRISTKQVTDKELPDALLFDDHVKSRFRWNSTNVGTRLNNFPIFSHASQNFKITGEFHIFQPLAHHFPMIFHVSNHDSWFSLWNSAKARPLEGRTGGSRCGTWNNPTPQNAMHNDELCVM